MLVQLCSLLVILDIHILEFHFRTGRLRAKGCSFKLYLLAAWM